MGKENRFIMMVGLPGSGKSTFAEELLSGAENCTLISSDKLRIELFDNVNDKENDEILFEEIRKRIRNDLLSGKNVIFDATNISSKRRRGFINGFGKKVFSDTIFECYYINTGLSGCLTNNSLRDRKVPAGVILGMHKRMTVPMYHEGWDKVEIVSQNKTFKNQDISKLLEECVSYQEFINILKPIPYFNNIVELSQDSSYHSLSVSRHTYYVYKYIMENIMDSLDREILLYSAIFHDTGKATCKNYGKDGNDRYANFIGHENVSGQLALEILLDLGVDKNITLRAVELIQMHMRIMHEGKKDTAKGNQKLLNLIGTETYELLEVLREADLSAK